MRNITYKYNIGDLVRFKNKFHPTASCGLREVAGQVARIIDRKDYAGPAYAIEGSPNTFYKEACFAGRAVLSVDTPEGTISTEVVKHQGAEINRATDQPSEFNEAKWWYQESLDETGEFDYICSVCGHTALHDYHGRSIASKFCPHCGKHMTNHQQEDEEDV